MKNIIKKIVKTIVKELGAYWAEFYANSSFGVRITIMVFYFLVAIIALFVKYWFQLAIGVSFLIWFIILACILILSHFLTSFQTAFMVFLWILFFAVLVKASTLVLVVAYCYLRVWIAWRIKGK